MLYRRLSANLYRTAEPGRYYHIHGSLEASTTLKMLGLPPYAPELTDYRACLDRIGAAVKRLTPAELEARNAEHRQAGAPALTRDEFLATPHGRAVASLPPFTVRRVDEGDVGADSATVATPPIPFPAASSWPQTTANGNGDGNSNGKRPRQILEGIKVLELCRVIAGPTIGRSLAALGASVLRVGSPRLPDVSFFQADVNAGKHAAWLDLRREGDGDGDGDGDGEGDDRARLDALIDEADVVIDGYRPGALARWGCGPADLARRARRRGRGVVYVAEDCFGGSGMDMHVDLDGDGAAAPEWSHRPGWQQIADCVTGVAWEQGRFMSEKTTTTSACAEDEDASSNIDVDDATAQATNAEEAEAEAEAEPIVPPFPMSDYGTGCLGSAAALAGLFRRAESGGSWACRTSLAQYDLYLQSLGAYPRGTRAALRRAHDPAFFRLRHDDSVDVVSAAALASVRRLFPALFDGKAMMHSAPSGGFFRKGGAAGEGGEEKEKEVVVTWPREAVRVEGWKIGHVRPSRANGYDPPEFGDWERDESLLLDDD